MGARMQGWLNAKKSQGVEVEEVCCYCGWRAWGGGLEMKEGRWKMEEGGVMCWCGREIRIEIFW